MNHCHCPSCDSDTRVVSECDADDTRALTHWEQMRAAETKLDIVKGALTRFGLTWEETAHSFTVTAPLAKLAGIPELPKPTSTETAPAGDEWTTWDVPLDMGSAVVEHCSTGVEGFPAYRLKFRGRWLTISDAEKIAATLLAAAKLGRLQEPTR